MKNLKMLTVGVIIGATITTTASVLAEMNILQAYNVSHYKIKVDGKLLEMPKDMTVLNYDNRTYTPAKLIVEGMGGEVTFDEANQTVNIKKPAPEIKEVIKEVEKIVYVETKDSYQELPITKKVDNIQAKLADMVRLQNQALAGFEVENKNQKYILFHHNDFRIEAGEKTIEGDGNFFWGSSIGGSGGILNGQIYFQKLPEDLKKFTVVLPYEMEGSSDTKEFRYDVNLED